MAHKCVAGTGGLLTRGDFACAVMLASLKEGLSALKQGPEALEVSNVTSSDKHLLNFRPEAPEGPSGLLATMRSVSAFFGAYPRSLWGAPTRHGIFAIEVMEAKSGYPT